MEKMICTMPIKTFSSGSFDLMMIDLTGFGDGEVSSKKKPVTSKLYVTECSVVLPVASNRSKIAVEFWDGLYNGIRGRSRKSERDFIVDPSMSVDDILKAIGG
ncbi:MULTISPECIES: hypothetical protein [Klebsiella pneumoniae complex]|uniref:hypothetical protein n=1 Tax=Klebsiella pneumoniae complex TaxID=3390273 RepID=UPI0011517D66|nr:hypothetical protein [Klebsiella pneumoniae]HDT3093952.1 hypothetical protein [Klebsiella pneumoniae subsp. pneumoniae]MBG1891992.1 hypothetical protein [Klebsiella pneumoniae]MBG2058259.1 hypothetical protein [Klebsiella pneumoniae]MBS2816570.1 hypothetical protein [Klebsiella pneumoniae]MCQ0861823.1 hypothetical protein [Klebsiella pneumoniae]